MTVALIVDNEADTRSLVRDILSSEASRPFA